MCKKHRIDLHNPFIYSNFAANFKKDELWTISKGWQMPNLKSV
jgi:hypothetical protein